MSNNLDFSSLLFPKTKPQDVSGDWRSLFKALEDPLWDLFDLSRLQEPSTIWSLRFSFALAQDLIDEKGFINPVKLKEAKFFLRLNSNAINPQATSISYRLQHIKRVLEWLETPQWKERLEKITQGRGNSSVERILKLCARAAGPISQDSFWTSDRWVRVSILSAWFHYIRQVVGSCFATAPAILVQQHQPEMFLGDMQQIVEHGSLKRVVDGKELQVPAGEDPGVGDLRKRFGIEPAVVEAPGMLWAITKALETTKEASVDLKNDGPLRLEMAADIFAKEGYLCAQNMIEGYLCRQFNVSQERFREYLKRPIQNIASGSIQIEKVSKETAVEILAERYRLAQEYFCLLTEHPLQRSWEFTLASFSDTRSDYCLWSLHTSLGLNAQEPEGLAEKLYQLLDDKVKEYNEKSAEMQPRCEDMDYQVQHVMGRLQNSRDEHEMNWLRAEYQNSKAERDQLIQERDTYHEKAQSFANLFHSLLDEYIRLFEGYFQQVYDPQMRDTSPGPYEDSPAGFRLVFKSGRSLASSWMSIQNGAQYIDAIARFLVVTEQEIISQETFRVIQDDFGHIVTLLVQHIRSERFLTKAFERMAKGLQMNVAVYTLEEKEKSPVKPWAYISGGTMGGLVSHYYGKSEPAREKKSWFQDVQELWVFLIDAMRDMPSNWSERFRLDPTLSLLMHSSKHAFLFLPGHPTFVEGWSHSGYPYTWIRDSYIALVRERYSSCFLEPEAQELILNHLSLEMGIAFPFEITKMSPRLRPYDLRRELVKKIGSNLPLGKKMETFSEKLDSLLLRMLPIHDLVTAKRKIREFCMESQWLASKTNQKVRSALWSFCEKELQGMAFVSAQQTLKIFSLAMRQFIQGPTNSPLNPVELRQEFARFGLSLPLPVFFADSNWDHYHFAFVLSPGTDQLEIWRLKPDSHVGYPMNDWKEQFHERAQENLWGLYLDPQDYLEIGWQA